MGRAGTVYINDYTNDLYLVRNEFSLDGNIMPVSVTRTFKNTNNTEFNAAGTGWHWNYISTLTRERISGITYYKWINEDGSITYFKATDDTAIWSELGVTDGYTLTIGESTYEISSTDDEYKYIFDSSSRKLIQIKDSNDNAISLTYSDDYGLNSITDGVGRKYSFELDSNNTDSVKYIDYLYVYDTNNEKIEFDDSALSLTYGYETISEDNSNKYLKTVTYADSKSVEYFYDSNGNMTTIKNIDGTTLSVNYNANGKVTGYTKYASDGTTILDSLSINADEPYQRLFTDKSNTVVRQQYDSSLNMVSEITDNDGIFSEYNTENELVSLSITEEHTNLLTNGDFESSSNGWTLSSRATVLTDNTSNTNTNIYKPTLGTNALQITGSSTGLGYATQVYNIDRIDGDENNVYTLGAWLKTNGSIAKNNRTVSIIIKNYTTEGVGETITSITYDNSISDWQYMMVSFTLPDDAIGVQVALSYNYQIGTALFDDVTLYKGEYSTVVNEDPVSTCICEKCINSDCLCTCELEENCSCNSCQMGTTTVKNGNGLATSETTTDAVTSMQSTYTYTTNNNHLAESIDINGTTTYYTYDANSGLLTSLATGNTENAINYSYNAVGLLKTISQTVTNIVTGEDVTMTSQYNYDGDTLTSITHNGFSYNYEYDIYGNITSVKVNSSSLADYGRTLTSSFGETDKQISTQYSYLSNGDYTTNQVGSSSTAFGTSSYNYTYTYDETGRLATKSLNGKLLVAYFYDEAGQVVRENNKEVNETYLYTYDEGGNKTYCYYTTYTDADVDIESCYYWEQLYEKSC